MTIAAHSRFELCSSPSDERSLLLFSVLDVLKLVA